MCSSLLEISMAKERRCETIQIIRSAPTAADNPCTMNLFYIFLYFYHPVNPKPTTHILRATELTQNKINIFLVKRMAERYVHCSCVYHVFWVLWYMQQVDGIRRCSLNLHPSVDCRDKIINYFVKLKTYKIIILKKILAGVRKAVDLKFTPGKRQRYSSNRNTLVKLTES